MSNSCWERDREQNRTSHLLALRLALVLAEDGKTLPKGGWQSYDVSY